MKQPACPRCLEPFEKGNRFCKQCGLRKDRPFSQKHWWSGALVIDLLLTIAFAVCKEKFLVAEGQPLDLATGTSWLVLVLFSLSLLPPTLCVNGICSVFWLRRHGATVEGEVIEYREYQTRKGTLLAAIVTFVPDIAQAVPCCVEHKGAVGVLPLHRKVTVRYDPYNPGSCAQVGAGWSRLILNTLWGLLLAGIPVLIVMAVWQILQAPV